MTDHETLPRPPYLRDEWLRHHGIAEADTLLRRLRPERAVMTPAALRAVRATRLSFSRSLIRRMAAERWRIEPHLVEIDAEGEGRLVYEITAAGRRLHFAVAAYRSDGTVRAGRVADMEYDFLGAILDGPVDPGRVDRELAELTTRVWGGRTDNGCLGWTAANRSNRFFDHTVERLSRGEQPDIDLLAAGGGYLIRNAGWLGNGRFGTRSWLAHGADHPLSYPYHCDIFALYLYRIVGFTVVEAMARARNPRAAVPLSPALKRVLGIGNSSGVGMVAALVRWPAWISAYTFPRELALAFATSRTGPPEPARAARFLELLSRAAAYYDEQPGCPVSEIEEPQRVAAELRRFAGAAEALLERRAAAPEGDRPWSALAALAAQSPSPEMREQVNALLIEIFPEFGDAAAGLLPEAMRVKREIRPGMTVGELRALIATRYRWAVETDRAAPEARAHFWYRSEDSGENRRGERAIDPGVDRETFVDVLGAVQALAQDLARVPDATAVGRYLIEAPQHAHAVSRVQLAAVLPYTEIRGNIIGADFLPMDGIRFLLSTMGLESSHPHNTRWVRGVFLQGAPSVAELASGREDDWIFPTLARATVAAEAT